MLWLTSFSCIWLRKTIFRFYMNVVDKNDFLRVFHVFDCWKQYLDFTWMLWIIMTSLMFSCIWLLKTIFRFYMDVVDNNDFLHVFHVFGFWKQYLDFTWMLYIMMTSSMYLFFNIWLFGNNIYILHRYIFVLWIKWLP